MGEQKRNIELIANNSSEALALKKSLEKEGFNVNHIYTGSSAPVLKDGNNYITGARNIRRNYTVK